MRKFLSITIQKIKTPYTRQQHDLYNTKIIAMIKKIFNYALPRKYQKYYISVNSSSEWIYEKKLQLWE